MKRRLTTALGKAAFVLTAVTIIPLLYGCGADINAETQAENEWQDDDQTVFEAYVHERAEQIRSEEKEKEERELLASTNPTGEEKYLVTFELKQSHFTLDLDEHVKDAMNKLELQIPVDRDYYYSIEVGDKIVDDFRWGSLVVRSSLGKWKITVKDKEVVYPEDVTNDLTE